MPKQPREIAGFAALPLVLKTASSQKDAKHYIYVKPHEPRVPDEDTARSLFLVNIPTSTTEQHIRHLFATQLEAGRVERVEFSENGISKSSALIASTKSSRKRKRQTIEDLEAGLEIYHLPSTFHTDIQLSGSTAIATFVDRQSMENSIKAVRKAIKNGRDIIWGHGLDPKFSVTGLTRYEAHKTLQYPSRADLLQIVDNYMTAYSNLESARSAENTRKRAAPDEDGFVTVTRGAKGSTLKKEEADELRAKQKAKEKGLEDFYRFQMREKRKEEQGSMLRKFEEDKKRVEEMRRRRGVLKPEG